MGLSSLLDSAIFVYLLGLRAYAPGVNIDWPPRFALFTDMRCVVTRGWQAIKRSRYAGQQGCRRSARAALPVLMTPDASGS